MSCYLTLFFHLNIDSNHLVGKYHEVEDVIYTSFQANTDLDTVVYNTFIKAMLEAGRHCLCFLSFIFWPYILEIKWQFHGTGKLRFAVSIYERMLFENISPSIQTYNLMIRLVIMIFWELFLKRNWSWRKIVYQICLEEFMVDAVCMDGVEIWIGRWRCLMWLEAWVYL